MIITSHMQKNIQIHPCLLRDRLKMWQFFQMKLVSFSSDHPLTPSKWKCEKQNTDVS